MFKKSLLILFVIISAKLMAGDHSDSIIKWRSNVKIEKDGNNSFFKVTGPELVFSSEFIAIDAKISYTLQGKFKSGNDKLMLVHCGLAQYDKNKKIITSTMVTPVIGSETELLKPANFGDKVIKLKTAPEWSDAIKKKRLVIAFDIDNSGNYTDLPNRKLSSIITQINQKNGAWEVVLEKPLDFSASAGTKVRAHIEGGSFLMIVFTIRRNLDIWTPRSGRIRPEVKLNAPNMTFWRGTKFARVLMSCNRIKNYYSAILLFKDISLSQVK